MSWIFWGYKFQENGALWWSHPWRYESKINISNLNIQKRREKQILQSSIYEGKKDPISRAIPKRTRREGWANWSGPRSTTGSPDDPLSASLAVSLVCPNFSATSFVSPPFPLVVPAHTNQIKWVSITVRTPWALDHMTNKKETPWHERQITGGGKLGGLRSRLDGVTILARGLLLVDIADPPRLSRPSPRRSCGRPTLSTTIPPCMHISAMTSSYEEQHKVRERERAAAAAAAAAGHLCALHPLIWKHDNCWRD
jgi:hypothetical protein